MRSQGLSDRSILSELLSKDDTTKTTIAKNRIKMTTHKAHQSTSMIDSR